jgi:GH18 family chitinase
MGYYASWQSNLYPVSRIDFTALTHIALAHWMTNSNGTLQVSDLDTGGAPIISAAHAAGVKAIMMLGGSDDTNFASAASSANRPTLVNAILAKLQALGLDGVDLDWENNINNSDFIALAQALRQASPSLIITAPVDPTLDAGSLAAGLAAYCDQVNMMSYADSGPYPGWQSWYFSALDGDGSTHPSSINRFVTNWVGAGVPASKIGVGIGFYATGWTSPVTGALQSISGSSMPLGELPYGASSANGGGVLNWFYNQAGANYSYDAGPAQQPSISIPAGMKPSGWTGPAITWVTYEDEASIAAKANYAKANGLGGVIIWTVNEGATDPITGRNPLLDAVKLGFLNNGPAPMPLQSSAQGYVAGPTSIVVTGLSTALNQVVVRWWNGDTSFDESVSSYGSYGRPSEYYIEASPDGTNWTSLTHVSGNSYNQRQFLYDFTGKGYTQVRLRVVSIVGTYGGNDILSVHSAPSNSTDSYLLLGDSITSNCWAAANNAFPNEPFGAGVNTVRPNRYPVMTEGGIPGLLSASPLAATPQNIPVIRKWLQDFPTVKYVGLSYGTNDANGSVPAATYCSNMKSLVQEVIAAGKTPVIPMIVASPASAVQANAPAMNACLATLQAQYPSIIKGPDLWTVFQGHSVADGWFFDELHPSLGTGCSALQNAWVNTMSSTLYLQ